MIALFVLLLSQTPADRAAQICGYDVGEDRWRCDPQGLKHFDLRIDASTDGGAGVDVTFRPLTSFENPACIAAIDVTLASDVAVVVDWPRVMATQSGDVIALITESARRQKQPPTKTASEAGVPLHDVLLAVRGPCVLRAAPPAGTHQDMFELRLPLVVNGKQTAAVWKRNAEWVAMTERDAMQLLGTPADPGPPPPEPSAGESGLPTYAIAGGILGGVLAVVAGAVLGLGTLNNQENSAANYLATAGCCAGCALPVSAGALGGGGFFLDQNVNAERERARVAYRTWLERKKARDAYNRRIGELSR